MPWKLLESAGAYLFVWLIGYSSLLGPIAGIMITDYFFVRKCRLDTAELYREGVYAYTGGWNMRALAALCLGIAPSLPEFSRAVGLTNNLPSFFTGLYDHAWFVGALLAGVVYYVLMQSGCLKGRAQVRPPANSHDQGSAHPDKM